jgi:D-alanyl-D-alanine carboxypeptidase (penicillin-binding protein 5/6)
MSRRVAAVVALLLGTALAGAVAVGIVLRTERDEGSTSPEPSSTAAATRQSSTPTSAGTSLTRAELRRERRDSRFAVAPAPRGERVRIAFKPSPRAGMLFDVRSGDVLWERNPDLQLPIASLTKMMTALIIAERHRFSERVMIRPDATRTPGSGVGVLPAGKRVSLGALMYGLLLVSGNDAAVALAEYDAGGVGAFVDRMNQTARHMGLTCTHFTTPHGLQDAGNYSCARDLAALARADLANPKLRAIAQTNRARLPFPIKGGYLDLYNNNPFIRAGTPGITGLKTGYTAPAGRCYVTTARRGTRELGVVLLHSPDPLKQVPALLEKGATPR